MNGKLHIRFLMFEKKNIAVYVERVRYLLILNCKLRAINYFFENYNKLKTPCDIEL